MKTTDTQPVIVTVAPTTVSRYLEASEEVEQALGASPGPAGKQFYLYVTQTIDEDDAKIGGTSGIKKSRFME